MRGFARGCAFFILGDADMKLLIAGSRSITNIDLEMYVPTDTTLIISGGGSHIYLYKIKKPPSAV